MYCFLWQTIYLQIVLGVSSSNPLIDSIWTPDPRHCEPPRPKRLRSKKELPILRNTLRLVIATARAPAKRAAGSNPDPHDNFFWFAQVLKALLLKNWPTMRSSLRPPLHPVTRAAGSNPDFHDNFSWFAQVLKALLLKKSLQSVELKRIFQACHPRVGEDPVHNRI